MATWKSFFAFGVQPAISGHHALADPACPLFLDRLPALGGLWGRDLRSGGKETRRSPGSSGNPGGSEAPPHAPGGAYKSFDRYRPAALAQESRSATERLKTGFCGVPSLSAQK